MKKKVLLAMSGGVDSSVSSYILIKEGYEVTGVTMKLHNKTDGEQSACGSFKDIQDAKAVAKKMGFEHIVLDLSKEYKETVIKYFLDDYMAGKTPNPCSKCNRILKFEIPSFIKGYDYFATGHYCNIEFDEKTKRYGIRKAFDKTKDQSYFLSLLTQKQLMRTIFPIGDKLKTDLKKLSAQLGLVSCEKKESQDFKGTVLFSKINQKTGNIVGTDGKKLGEHKGIHLYTIGQRKGLGVSSSKPLYVIKIDCIKNEIVLGEEKYLYSKTAIISNINLMTKLYKKGDEFKVLAKIRFAHKGSNATVKMLENDKAELIFEQPEQSVTPGQIASFYDFYDNDKLLGGGYIESTSLT